MPLIQQITETGWKFETPEEAEEALGLDAGSSEADVTYLSVTASVCGFSNYRNLYGITENRLIRIYTYEQSENSRVREDEMSNISDSVMEPFS